MVIYKPSRGVGAYYVLATTIIYNIIIAAAAILIDSYIVSSLFKLFLLLFNLYQLYYLLLFITLKYSVNEQEIYIRNIFKTIKLSLNDIEGYQIKKGSINGIRLSGFCTNRFAMGKSFIKNIGTTNMFVTTNKDIFYLKNGVSIYAISPSASSEFEKVLEKVGMKKLEWEFMWNKSSSLHKDKSYMIPFLVVSLLITILTLNPFVLYLRGRLPDTMPLSFDSSFLPVELGTGKQFAFNQMIYGVLNMAILFCMYYASHFYAKYDRRSAKKFIYVALVIAAAFLLIQLRILAAFR